MTEEGLGIFTWALALSSVTLSAIAQLLMKIGMTGLRAQGQLESFQLAAPRILLDPWVVGGLVSYAVSAVLWLLVLSRMPLSTAYPLVALAIVAVVVLSALLLGEGVSAGHLLGVGLIAVGILTVGMSART